jgi:hypothetical protein
MNLTDCKAMPNYNSNYDYTEYDFARKFTAECPDYTLKLNIDDSLNHPALKRDELSIK